VVTAFKILNFHSFPGQTAHSPIGRPGGGPTFGELRSGASQLYAVAEEPDNQPKLHLPAAVLRHQRGRLLRHFHAPESGKNSTPHPINERLMGANCWDLFAGGAEVLPRPRGGRWSHWPQHCAGRNAGLRGIGHCAG